MGSSLKQVLKMISHFEAVAGGEWDGGKLLVIEHGGQLGDRDPDEAEHARERGLGTREELVEQAEAVLERAPWEGGLEAMVLLEHLAVDGARLPHGVLHQVDRGQAGGALCPLLGSLGLLAGHHRRGLRRCR